MDVQSFCKNLFSGVNWEVELKVQLNISGISWKLNLKYSLVKPVSFHSNILNKLCKAVQYYVSYFTDRETEAQSYWVPYLSNALGRALAEHGASI